jgi:hypothetical protein
MKQHLLNLIGKNRDVPNVPNNTLNKPISKGGKMRKLYLRGFLFVFFSVIVFTNDADALRIKTDWAKRVDLSAKIIQGEVIDVKSYWNDEKTLILTDVTVFIDDNIKGLDLFETTITITIPGGTVGEETLWVSDNPQFQIGDYGVILLTASGQVTAGPDGIYRLMKPKPGTSLLQLQSEDNFLSWIKAYVKGDTKSTFEDAYQKDSAYIMQQDIAYATISGVNPSSVSAGTGSVITITGSGFGASRGTATYPTIAFRYKDTAGMWDNSLIKSWTDTQIQVEVFTKIIDNYRYAPGSWDSTVGFVDAAGNLAAYWPLTITFGYGSRKWNISTVTYYINASGGPSGSENAIQAATATWNNAGSKFLFQYGGSTTSGASADGKNVICFADLGDYTTIGLASTWSSNGIIAEADFQFNTRLLFSTAPTPSGSEYDLQTVALHELGHWLNLTDLYGANDSSKAMYGFGDTGVVKRILTSGDQSGIRWIYGTPTTSTIQPTTTTSVNPTTTTIPVTTTMPVTTTTSIRVTTTTSIQTGPTIVQSILTNQDPNNYQCGVSLPPAVSNYDASRDYAVCLYLIIDGIQAGDAAKTVWYYESQVYQETPFSFSQAGNFCYYPTLIINGQPARCNTGNWSVEFYLNNQKLV